jgi:hypothetical protein
MATKELGLVDHVGYQEDAIASAASMAGLADATIVAYDRGDAIEAESTRRFPR